jgi:major vault protein
LEDDVRGNRKSDLVLTPNQYAYVLDESKGLVSIYVGPNKTSISNTDKPVIFDSKRKQFIPSDLNGSIKNFSIAPEGWYVILYNPAEENKTPISGNISNIPKLNVGRKVNIPGPVSFALWPGQMAKVVKGHNLRSNQYLVVQVYDDKAATENWQTGVVKAADGTKTVLEKAPTLTMGQNLIIKGTDVSFYIPPTGIKVLPDKNDNEFVRNAITLERLEYCILLDENGNKRYIKGPEVVFPRPTESFIEKDGCRKFKAIELNEISGIYVKVIADYEENGKKHVVGDELFITGKESMIYFPREEHALIKYGDQNIHYAVAIPTGEARYVLDRLTGNISLKIGPTMFLPDPRKEVIVRRVLDTEMVDLYYPGNKSALDYNRNLASIQSQSTSKDNFVSDRMYKSAVGSRSAMLGDSHMGDEIERKINYTKPRSIVLDTKYDGAVTVGVWTGYAVLVTDKRGNRKVVNGPQTILLQYDETLESLELSTGTPKTDRNKVKTVYLRTLNNKVSDIVTAETKDLCNVAITLSYRVNFEGDSKKWFDVENYVKFLTDHTRSLIRNAVKKLTIENFYNNSIDLIRDMVLGTSKDGKRTGRVFTENGMKIYDVEVLSVDINDPQINDALVNAQRLAVKRALELQKLEQSLEFTKKEEGVSQEIAIIKNATKIKSVDLAMAEVNKFNALDEAKLNAKTSIAKKELDADNERQLVLDAINQSQRERKLADEEQRLEIATQDLKLFIDKTEAMASSEVVKMKAIGPELIAALEAFGDKNLVAKAAEAMGPLAMLGGSSVAEVLNNLLKGTKLEGILKK